MPVEETIPLSKDPKPTSSLRNALRLLKQFSVEEPEWGVSELADELDVVKSTAHRLVSTLADGGFVAKDHHTRKYRLGGSLLALGNAFTARLQLHREKVYPWLKELVEETGETAHIGVLQGPYVVYLYKLESRYPVRLLSYVGKRNPVHCTSTGQAVLAFRPPAVIREVLAEGLPAHGPNTPVTTEAMEEKLAVIRKSGYAVSAEELHAGVTSVGAPIRNGSGCVVASVNIAGPVTRIHRGTISGLSRQVMRAANGISKSLV
ncbi:IclR family transcriptional regulator [Melghirimyces profundicolus]|uniref:Glycerol operon regulatory protein n=1 Tax=Melghirimyces profundicolus TaxID=1242148 RepID=A0A2T6C8I3_9BACL|nr:IclR family transcriptional regulator [Melghirimyces profundicolus]PTX64631.1 IclR family transcriptional regulator [Melghirimyces profundicolus]